MHGTRVRCMNVQGKADKTYRTLMYQEITSYYYFRPASAFVKNDRLQRVPQPGQISLCPLITTHHVDGPIVYSSRPTSVPPVVSIAVVCVDFYNFNDFNARRCFNFKSTRVFPFVETTSELFLKNNDVRVSSECIWIQFVTRTNYDQLWIINTINYAPIIRNDV